MKNLDLERIGEEHLTLEGDRVEIVNYRGSYDVDVRLDSGHIFTVQYGHLVRGKVKNPYHPSIFSVGFIGVGNYKTKDGNKHFKSYITWRNILERGCSELYKKEFPSYKDVTVCEEWHNFQIFAKWFEDNYDYDFMDSSWHLDKDILKKGSRIYSPETCAFVPNEVNSFFVKGKSRRGECLIGVSKGYGKFMVSCNVNKKIKNLGYFTTELEAFQIYKDFKEGLAKKVADKWRGKITEKVYEAMYNYKVEIDD
jgi:hypothetical protein